MSMSMSSKSKSRARRASLGGPATATRQPHFLKGVAVAGLPNVLDLPDPPTPTPAPLASQSQQPVQKKRRRRHSISHVGQLSVPSVITAATTTTTTAAQQLKATAAVAQQQKNRRHKKAKHKKSKTSAPSAATAAAATFLLPRGRRMQIDTTNNNEDDDEDEDDTTVVDVDVDYYQFPNPLHPKEAPPANEVRGVLEQLRGLVHAYTDARHCHSESGSDAAAAADLLQQLQQQIQELTSNSNHYVLTPPLTHQQLLLQSQQQQQQQPQLRSEYDRRLTLWMQLGPAMQQLDQHKQATAASVSQALGLQVEKAPGSYYNYYCCENNRRRRVTPETYEQRYYDMLQQQQHSKPDWGAYFAQLRTLDASGATTTTATTTTKTTLDSIHSINSEVYATTTASKEDSTKRLAETKKAEQHQISSVPPESSTTKSEQSFDAATETSTPTCTNSIDEKLPHSAGVGDEDATENLKSIPFHTSLRPNTTMAMSLTLDKENTDASLLAASTNKFQCSESSKGKLIVDKQQPQLLLPPRPVARAATNRSRSLQDLPKTESLCVESSIVKPSSHNNKVGASVLKVRSPANSPSNVRAACHKKSPPLVTTGAHPIRGAQESRTISNNEDNGEFDKANDDDSRTTVAAFDLLPIPDRDAPSQHPEIAAAEERLFQALDVALDTYSREVAEIRQREVAAQREGDGL